MMVFPFGFHHFDALTNNHLMATIVATSFFRKTKLVATMVIDKELPEL
jgi:hypothetical protein